MTGTRDEFSRSTKNALALRAGYVCSVEGCGRSTVGPSDEGPAAVTQIGVAAHICAAAPGPGARRYDPAMTPEQRASIENGIWLCAGCATMIDRDAVTFPAERLRKLKLRHEESRRLGPSRAESGGVGDVIAIGPDIVGVGEILACGSMGFRVRLDHFVIGTGRDLLAFVDSARLPVRDRYVLLNELGDGRMLSTAPEVTRAGNAYEVQLATDPGQAREPWNTSSVGMCRELGRLIRGMDVFVQHLETLLGLAIGDNVFHPRSGTRISQFYRDYAGSPWLGRFIKMELVRLAAIPVKDGLNKTHVTPLRCVNRVRKVKVPSLALHDRRLAVTVDLELEGLGDWERTLSVFIYTDEQLEAAARDSRASQGRCASRMSSAAQLTT